MSLLKIARMGHPVLLARAAPVADPTDPAIRVLAADMIETMHDAPGIGLAAPQVFRSLRMFVFRLPARRADPDDAVPETVVINPEIAPLGDAMAESWEGCLSIPGLRARVPRPAAIRYAYTDTDGVRHEREATGLHAAVVQHEYDHLEGILYTMRLTDFASFGFEPELQRRGVL